MVRTRVKVINAIAIIITVVALVSLVYGLLNYSELEGAVNENLRGYGLFGVFVFAFMFDLIPNYIAPHIGILNAGLFGINLFWAVVFVALGSTFGSILGFWIGRKYGIEVVGEFIQGKKIGKFVTGINRWGKWIVLVAAFSPIPYLPLVIGSFYFTKRNFILYGLIPRVLSFVIVGIVVGFVL